MRGEREKDWGVKVDVKVFVCVVGRTEWLVIEMGKVVRGVVWEGSRFRFVYVKFETFE